MTTYSYTISTADSTAHGPGELVGTEDYTNEGDFISSNDIPDIGATVIDRSGHKRNVSSYEDLRGDDRVTVGGITMTVDHAEALGMSAIIRSDFEKVSATVEDDLQSILDGDRYEPEAEVDLTNGLDAAQQSEITTAQTMSDALAYQTNGKLDFDQALEIAEEVLTGNMTEQDYAKLDEYGVSKANLHGMVNQMKALSEQSARKELGDAKFKELNTIASYNPAVRKLVLTHAQARLKGSKVSWNDVYDLAQRAR
ncbi:hypothetical protein WDZ92_41050 [Nostoc sp. NIES-2111]